MSLLGHFTHLPPLSSLSLTLFLPLSLLPVRPPILSWPPSLSLPPSLPLLPCSTCLSELGWARCTPGSGGGPCLLSINNLWNSEIQVGPVSSRLYHTLEGGLPATLDGLFYLFWRFLSVFCRSEYDFGALHHGWPHFSRLFQLFTVPQPSEGPCGYSLWPQFLYGLHQWLLEWGRLHRDLHLSSMQDHVHPAASAAAQRHSQHGGWEDQEERPEPEPQHVPGQRLRRPQWCPLWFLLREETQSCEVLP